MKRKSEKIDSIVKSIIEKLDRHANPTTNEIEDAWRQLVGERASSHTRPAALGKKKLVINVDGSAWLYELTLRKNELLASLKKKFGEDKIKELQFRIGEI